MDKLMRKITGALMVIVGGFFIVAAVLAVVRRPEIARQLKGAPFITDGVLDPANEGKTVVLAFDIDDVSDVSDAELGFSFPYPCVSREVERLTYTLKNRKWEWRRVKDSEDELGGRLLFGDAGVGDFQIEGDLLRGLALYKDLYEDDFDSAELARLLDANPSLSTVFWGERFYFTNASWTYFEDYEFDGEDFSMRDQYAKQEGAIRIHYKGLPRAWYSQIAVIGKQEGNWIVEDDRIDDLTVYENVEDAEELVRQGNAFMGGGILLAAIPSAALVFFGILRITGKN